MPTCSSSRGNPHPGHGIMDMGALQSDIHDTRFPALGERPLRSRDVRQHVRPLRDHRHRAPAARTRPAIRPPPAPPLAPARPGTSAAPPPAARRSPPSPCTAPAPSPASRAATRPSRRCRAIGRAVVRAGPLLVVASSCCWNSGLPSPSVRLAARTIVPPFFTIGSAPVSPFTAWYQVVSSG